MHGEEKEHVRRGGKNGKFSLRGDLRKPYVVARKCRMHYLIIKIFEEYI